MLRNLGLITEDLDELTIQVFFSSTKSPLFNCDVLMIQIAYIRVIQDYRLDNYSTFKNNARLAESTRLAAFGTKHTLNVIIGLFSVL
jgi:hypothetical protein